MQGVTANINTMPISTLLIIIGGLLLVIIVAAFVIKKFGLDISKGSIKASTYEYDQKCILVNHKIKEDIDNIDWILQKNLREQTKNFSCKITEIGNVINMCRPTMRSIINTFKDPFCSCISNNHFTKEFMPTNFDSYRANLINAIKNEHQNLLLEYNKDKCHNNELSQWDKIETDVEHIVDDWLIMAMNEVKKTCYEKINLYKNEIKNLEKSQIWNEVISDCIAKNENYIKEISQRLQRMGYEN